MGRLRVNPTIRQAIITDVEFQAHMEFLGEQGLEFAVTHVPYDETSNEPHIRDSLHVTRPAHGGRRVIAGTDHWQFPEFGTVDMPAQPYLRPILTALGLRMRDR